MPCRILVLLGGLFFMPHPVYYVLLFITVQSYCLRERKKSKPANLQWMTIYQAIQEN